MPRSSDPIRAWVLVSAKDEPVWSTITTTAEVPVVKMSRAAELHFGGRRMKGETPDEHLARVQKCGVKVERVTITREDR